MWTYPGRSSRTAMKALARRERLVATLLVGVLCSWPLPPTCFRDAMTDAAEAPGAHSSNVASNSLNVTMPAIAPTPMEFNASLQDNVASP